MTEEEAIALLKQQFASEEGFIARLAQTGTIDNNGLEKTYDALDTLSTAWKGRVDMPKDVALSLVDVVTPIYSAAERYPSLENEILNLAVDINMRLDRLFYDRSDSMSELEAMAIVKAQLNGIPSVVLTLHQRAGLNKSVLEELYAALDALQVAWSQREDVPRTIVGPMVDARNAIVNNSGWYPPELQTELKEIGNDLCERVKRCLS